MKTLKFEQHAWNNNTLLPFNYHLDTIGNGIGCLPNWHQSLEILYFIEGNGQVICNSKITDVTAGDIFVVNPYNIHYVITKEPFVQYYCLLIGSTFFKENDIDINFFLIKNKITDESARTAYKNIIAAYKEKNSRFYIACTRSAVLSLLIYLGENNIIDDADCPETRNNEFENVMVAIDYIHMHFTGKITIDDIANEVCISKYHLSRMFKKATNYTIVSYINLLRCQYAQNLLTTTQYSISKISSLSGYENLSYFIRTYKTLIGILPSQTKGDLKLKTQK